VRLALPAAFLYHDRLEDIEPNLHFEIGEYAKRTGQRVTFTKDALQYFLSFAKSPEAVWDGNFRGLKAAVIRIATLTTGGKINIEVVKKEISRLQQTWRKPEELGGSRILGHLLSKETIDQLDPFDLIQLEDVIKVCLKHNKASEAGRLLYAKSREQKTTNNDSDRLGKYLRKFGIGWDDLQRLRRNPPKD
jgi:transcriptional regulatory protein RtcR